MESWVSFVKVKSWRHEQKEGGDSLPPLSPF